MTKPSSCMRNDSEPQNGHMNTKPSLNLYAQPIAGTYALKMHSGVWRVENKWIVSQGNTVSLTLWTNCSTTANKPLQQNNKSPTGRLKPFRRHRNHTLLYSLPNDFFRLAQTMTENEVVWQNKFYGQHRPPHQNISRHSLIPNQYRHCPMKPSILSS